MNREEAKYYLQSSGFSEEQIDTIEKAFTSTDAISRQAVFDLAKKGILVSNGNYESVCKTINKLPSVNPQPCEDAIDRAEAIKIASGYCHPANVAKELAKLPSVNPTKTGHWIEIAQYSDGNHKIECSECESHIFDRGHANSFNVKNKYKYCPNCGCRMVEPQERSDRA